MEEEVQFVIDAAKEHMDKTIKHFEHQLLKIRAGRANPDMLAEIRIDYYGTMSPLSNVSNLNTPDARTITIQPWEKGLIPAIEKAIMNAGLGFNPQNNGEMIIINVPPLTEERRKILVKQVHHEAEESRVGIRSARKEANDELKKLGQNGLSEDLVKDNEDIIQQMTDEYTKNIADHVAHKEKEIMTV